MTWFASAPVLETDRLTLGPATPDHAEAFIAFCETDASRFLGGPASRDDASEGVVRHAGQWPLRGYGTFWLSVETRPVGRVGVYHPGWRSEPELSWVIYPEHQGPGYATEAALASRTWAQEVVGLDRLMSLIDTGNGASARVAEKLGARVEAPHANPEGKSIMRWRHPAPEGRA
jgi:RimJ/RimL family protein N-acetyltransferase